MTYLVGVGSVCVCRESCSNADIACYLIHLEEVESTGISDKPVVHGVVWRLEDWEITMTTHQS